MTGPRPPKRKRLTPQEKKRLSYLRDRREAYGQNDKAARRLVPLHKAKANRRVRRGDKLALAAADPDALEMIAPRRPKPDWRKAPGVTLRKAVEASREARMRRSGRRHRTKQGWIAWYTRFYNEAVARRMERLLFARKDDG